jgi:7,8-dihydro-6-hydroxymethylpterin-pyrophosphokinase
MSLKKVYLSLGSNLGDREQNLRRGLDALDREHIRIVARSAIYETEPQDIRGAEALRKGPRVLDIDILLFGNAVMSTPQLTIPHPRMLQRRFVLEPLVEIAPDLRHPVTKESFSKYLVSVASQRVTRLYAAP